MSDKRHFISEVIDNPHHPKGRSLSITTPDKVIPIDSKEELQVQLEHYNRPFIRHVVHDSNFARKNYVEKVRPALRYFCAKYGVKVPKWLENEDYFMNLPDEEKESLFGTSDIKPKEFRSIRPIDGEVTRR